MFSPNGFHNIFMSVVKDHFRSIDLVKIQGNTIMILYNLFLYFYVFLYLPQEEFLVYSHAPVHQWQLIDSALKLYSAI